jgi:hypothetical protein
LPGDPSYAVRGLDEVIAGAAGLFAAESIGKDERFGELTSAHQEAGAVDSPLTFEIHKHFFHPSAGPGFRFWLSGFRFRPSTALLGGYLFSEWSDCTRRNRVGQLQKNCATVEFGVAYWIR